MLEAPRTPDEFTSFCPFIQDYFNTRLDEKGERQNNQIKDDCRDLGRLFDFLKEHNIETLDEYFFDGNKKELIESFFQQLANSDLGSPVRKSCSYKVFRFFMFCSSIVDSVCRKMHREKNARLYANIARCESYKYFILSEEENDITSIIPKRKWDEHTEEYEFCVCFQLSSCGIIIF